VSIEIRFLSGRDVEQLEIGPEIVLGAVEAALAAQGRGEVVLEPREHLVPDPAFAGHFNLLRAYVGPLEVAGVKVVGDYLDNWKLGLPSELALLTLYDPRTGVPRAIVDGDPLSQPGVLRRRERIWLVLQLGEPVAGAALEAAPYAARA